jgi:hypothetical protein
MCRTKYVRGVLETRVLGTGYLVLGIGYGGWSLGIRRLEKKEGRKIEGGMRKAE